jgi:hypothetical protein
MPASTAYPEILIKNDSLYTSDRHGNTGTRICESVSNAYWSDGQDIFLITKLNGKVEIRDRHGNLTRCICENAKDARFSDGTNIQVRMNDGQNRVLDKFGNLVRVL